MLYKKQIIFILSLFLPIALVAQIIPSDGQQEHWYYLTSTAQKNYCKGRIVYNVSPSPNRQLRWGDKTKDINAMWKFMSAPDGGYYIVNKATQFYMKSTSEGDKAGVVTCTNQQADATIFHIEKQGQNNSYTLAGENQNPIHAQEYAGMMVTWNEKAYGSASSWLPTAISSSEVASAERKARSYQEDYQLVWADEFNDTHASLDKNWNFEQGFVRNREDQWYQKDNATLPDTCLLIQAKRVHIPNPNYVAGSQDWKKNREYINYTSSALTTHSKFNFTYGRLEVRAKIPTSAGSWPAIWTLGIERPNTDFHWPHSGEVDLMEYYQGHSLANLVWGGNGVWNSIWESRKTPIGYWNSIDADWKSKFHTWRMDWDYESIKIYLDNELVTICNLNRTVNTFGNAKGKNPFRGVPQYILLNLALGGQSAGPIDNSAFPLDYRVDYVRVYQKKGQKHTIGQKEITTGIQTTTQTTSNALAYRLKDKVLTLNFNAPTQVHIYQIDGREVYHKAHTIGQQSIELQHLQSGVYILQVHNENGVQSTKISL